MSEYSYEIDKYIVGVDSNGEDRIGLTIATMKDNELHILGSCYGDNARFIDLLIKENQELKKQLEELKSTNKVLSEELTKDNILKQDCLTTCCGIPIGDIPKLINQQKEFIKYLEEEISKWHYNYDSNTYEYELEEPPAEELLVSVLSKYREIIGQQDGQVSGQV